MITGDQQDTAVAIAKQTGICTSEKAVCGREIDLMSDDELEKTVSECNVFARVSTLLKLLTISFGNFTGLAFIIDIISTVC